jgi:hypothetical protein
MVTEEQEPILLMEELVYEVEREKRQLHQLLE